MPHHPHRRTCGQPRGQPALHRGLGAARAV